MVRRKVDSQGTTPLTPRASPVAWSWLAAHSVIAVKDRAPARTAHTARPEDHRQPVTKPARAGIRKRGQHRQQPRRFLSRGLRGGHQLANRRVNQRL